jgi:seryl-tRNA synthetase
MIDLNHLLTNPEIFINEINKRGGDAFLVNKIIELENYFRPKQQELENLRRVKNEFNDKILKLNGEERIAEIQKMKNISDQIKSLETETKESKDLQTSLLYKIPNLTWSGIPVGPDENSNVEISVVGNKKKYSFTPKNYYDLELFKRDYKSQKGIEAAGYRGFYITGELAKLQKSLYEWVMERLIAKGFDYIIPPVMINENVLYGTGFFPSGIEDVYTLDNNGKILYLPGTSEAALMFLYSNETLDLTISSKKLTAQTRCFRSEAGKHGADTKGGMRVHEFEKIETVCICRPEDSEQTFEYITNNFRETLNELDLFYHELEICTGDISIKNNRQIDIEGFFPGANEFRELCSSSNCSDYQTRNLNIKTVDSKGETVLAHSLNCTGVVNRTLWCILEQNQNEDGSVNIPTVLVDKFGKNKLV